MDSNYTRALDLTLQYLETQKAQGIRYLRLNAETLDALKQPVRPAPRAAAPATKPAAPAQTFAAQPAATSPSASEGVERAGVKSGEKEAAIAELRARAMACRKCPNLAAARTNVVFGVGDIHSPLMFVGEAPGAEEDRQGEPFVGQAGRLLTKIITAMGFSRESVYIANILKCRPDTPGQRTGNRKPEPEEMNTCLPYLLEQIDIIRPRLIVALGATAVEGLFGKTIGITRQRGNWMAFREIPVMPTYHPAYLLHKQSVTEKRKVWEDMLKVMEALGAPISEKQRHYFLKG